MPPDQVVGEREVASGNSLPRRQYSLSHALIRLRARRGKRSVLTSSKPAASWHNAAGILWAPRRGDSSIWLSQALGGAARNHLKP